MLDIFQGSALQERSHAAMRKALRRFAPAVIYAVGIWVIGGVERPPEVYPPGLSLDKAAHFAMYGGLGFLVGRAWARAARGRSWVFALLLVLLLGAADELRQSGIPGRAAELADWVADAAGASLGFLLAVKLVRRTRQIEENERE